MEKTEAVGMACPVCHVDLVMSERHGVEIDYCPKCRGVWLDRGELDKIIEKAVAAAQPAPQPQAASFLPQTDPLSAPWGGSPVSPPRYREDRDWDDRRERRDHDHDDHHAEGRRGGWLNRLID